MAVLLNSLPREPATHSSAGPSNKKLVHLPLMYINLPIASEVPLVAPADSCCNCGSISKISPMATDLRRMPLMGLAGTEITVVLPFPYCDVCAVTARRRRPSPLGVMAITCLLSLCFGMTWLFFGPLLSEAMTTYVLGPIVVSMSLALVVIYYRLRKPNSGQTSYYQPVKLKHTGHKWPADISGLELAFTNHAYATAFATANQAAIAVKKLKVSLE